MTEISFYHLTKQPLEEALPMLLERVLKAGLKAVILSSSTEKMDDLDRTLWTYEERSFLPHDTEKSKTKELQPLYLTTELKNPNEATVLVLTNDMSVENFEGFDRVLEMFNGNDENSVLAARTRWKAYTDQGHDLTYWQQSDTGGWAKK